jgi:hypothetical protein
VRGRATTTLVVAPPRIRPDLETAPNSPGVRYRGALDNTGILQLSGGLVGHIGDTTNPRCSAELEHDEGWRAPRDAIRQSRFSLSFQFLSV